MAASNASGGSHKTALRLEAIMRHWDLASPAQILPDEIAPQEQDGSLRDPYLWPARLAEELQALSGRSVTWQAVAIEYLRAAVQARQRELGGSSEATQRCSGGGEGHGAGDGQSGTRAGGDDLVCGWVGGGVVGGWRRQAGWGEWAGRPSWVCPGWDVQHRDALRVDLYILLERPCVASMLFLDLLIKALNHSIGDIGFS